MALAVVALLGHSVRTGLVVAMGLAQVGEFSFILGDLARHHGLLPQAGSSLLVACALVSISVNPFLFRALDPLEEWLRRHPRLWKVLGAVGARRRDAVNVRTARAIEERPSLAVVVGHGPVGQAVDRALREAGTEVVVVDQNMDTVGALAGAGRLAIYGDASAPEVLRQAGVPRARYLQERAELEQVGAAAACFEEAEAAVALTARVLADLGLDPAKIAKQTDRVRRETMGDEAYHDPTRSS